MEIRSSNSVKPIAIVGAVVALSFVALTYNNVISQTYVAPIISKTIPSSVASIRGPNAAPATIETSANLIYVGPKANPEESARLPSTVLQAWGLACCLFAALGAVVYNKYSGRRSIPEDFDGVQVLSSISMTTATGEKEAGGRRHDFALIVNNKGGGHGEIGMHLALALRAKGLEVQLINDTGGKDVSSKPPFSEYGQLTAAGVEVTYVDLSKPGVLDFVTCPPEHLCRAYDYVFDNQNVCQRDVANLAAQCGAFYVYVSSGGMYIPGEKFPMKESNPSKGADANEQKKHEEYVMSSEVRPQLRGCAFFRPQYIVGPYTNKRDYLDWFFDRLTRNLPIPLPAPGTQTTTITDVRDVANMLASVVGKRDDILEAEKANPQVGPVFNCASDRPVTLRQIAIACGLACGKSEAETEALIRLYDPKLAKEAPSGGKFPFRATNFDVGVDKAKVVLEWEPEYNDFEAIAAGYYAGYTALGLDKNNPKMDTSFDEYILSRI